MKLTGNTILMTGGGSGIGRALAQRFHDLGNAVIITGRRRSALDETIAGRDRMTAMTLDVENVEAIRDAAHHLAAKFPALNILINNAGIMRSEDLSQARDPGDREAMITTNLLGPMRMIDALVGQLQTQANAAIINMTSGLAFVPLAMTPTYSATKAALHSYTLSLRQQLKGKVEVIEIAPPGVQTELTPGQSTRSVFQSLDSFADEVMTLFAQVPTPAEILVKNVQPLRFAERDGMVDTLVERMASGPPA